MNDAQIKCPDVANGPGCRVSLFVSGCTHHCKGCFNEEAWDFSFGRPFTEETIRTITDLMKPDFIQGLTLLGGEPFEPENQKGILPLLRSVRKAYPQKDIWAFSGYLFDADIMGRMYGTVPETKEIIENIDVLVDGEFVLEKRDLMLRFKGSSNQRTIDVPASLKAGKVVLLF